METKTLILKDNSPDIRKKIEGAGIQVCYCSAFVDSCWLVYYTLSNLKEVHGVGYTDEENKLTSSLLQKREIKRFIKESKNPVICENVDDFINKIKESTTE